MSIQLKEDIPAICENKDCDNYKAFELYEVEEVIASDTTKDYVICYSCKQKIFICD